MLILVTHVGNPPILILSEHMRPGGARVGSRDTARPSRCASIRTGTAHGPIRSAATRRNSSPTSPAAASLGSDRIRISTRNLRNVQGSLEDADRGAILRRCICGGSGASDARGITIPKRWQVVPVSRTARARDHPVRDPTRATGTGFPKSASGVREEGDGYAPRAVMRLSMIVAGLGTEIHRSGARLAVFEPETLPVDRRATSGGRSRSCGTPVRSGRPMMSACTLPHPSACRSSAAFNRRASSSGRNRVSLGRRFGSTEAAGSVAISLDRQPVGARSRMIATPGEAPRSARPRRAISASQRNRSRTSRGTMSAIGRPANRGRMFLSRWFRFTESVLGFHCRA